MNKYEITSIIEEFAPIDTQEGWDCSGWLVDSEKNEIQKILLALTVTDDICNQAKLNNCEMIISHHPLFCVPVKYRDVNIYCAHTNADKANGGTTDSLIKVLGFKEKIEKSGDFVRMVRLNEPMSIQNLETKLRKISPNLRYVKHSGEISSIGFCAGSGGEFINTADVDAFVTGDLKFHGAVETNKTVFDIGHFESEIFILDVFKGLLENIAGHPKIIIAEEKSPFMY